MPLETQILQAFRLIDERADAGPPLRALRERLAGELLGDPERVAATLAPEFELVSHAGGPTTTTPGSAIVEGLRNQGDTGALMWVELDDLVADDDVVACDGVLCMCNPGDRVLTTIPLAIFLRFAGDRMTREVMFMDVTSTETTDLAGEAVPSVEQLRTLLDAGTVG